MIYDVDRRKKFFFTIDSPWPHKDSIAMDVSKWCSENCEPHTCYPVPGTFTLLMVFFKEVDATAFKLRFGL